MLKDLLISVIGNYEPYTIYDSAAQSVCSSWDWTWIGSFLLLLCFIYCFLRALGGLLSGK